MGILDSIFGTSGSGNTQAAVGQGVSDIWSGVEGANKTLNNTTRQAADAFRTGAQGATDALTGAYGQARSDLTGYGAQAQGQLAQGRDSALATILGGNANYQPFLSSGTGATSMIANALGLNGAAGNDAATAAFRADPGYAFTRDEATDTTARKMAALGMAGSGNTLSAITEQASGLADQTYQKWLGNLGSLAGQGLTAAGGISSNNANAGNIQFNAGNQAAQLSQGLGSSLGSLGMNLGSALGTIQSNLGNSLGGLQQQLGQQKAANTMTGATGSANLGVLGGQAADNAENASNSVISKLLGSAIGLPMGGATTGYGAGGFSVTPGSNGAFSISPTATTSNSNILNTLVSKL